MKYLNNNIDKVSEYPFSRLRNLLSKETIKNKTGLLLDPYFSATKISWILDNISGARQKAINGELRFGTVDTYLLWQLSDGAIHKTDVTNASRTNLFNIHSKVWDQELLDIFNIPSSMLPNVHLSDSVFGEISRQNRKIKISGLIALLSPVPKRPSIIKSGKLLF